MPFVFIFLKKNIQNSNYFMHCQGGKVFRTEMNSLAKPLYMQCHRVPSNIRSQIILS